MSKEIEYLNNNRNSKKTPLEKAADRILANREKAWIAKEKQLENFYNHEHKQRIEAIPMNQRTWSDVNLMESIRKSEQQDDHYYDIGKKYGDDTRSRSDIGDKTELDSEAKFYERLEEVKEFHKLVSQTKAMSIPVVAENMKGIGETLKRIDAAVKEGLSPQSIEKAFKGYKKPCPLKKSGKYVKKSCNDYKCITKDYVHIPKVDSGYEKQELIDVRDEINKVLSDLENFDRL